MPYVNNLTHIPAADPVSGYLALDNLQFPGITPNALAKNAPIPPTNVGSTALHVFDKLKGNDAPWAKLVIKSQLLKV